jgi:dTDP-4-dehydrorhamnose reductase
VRAAERLRPQQGRAEARVLDAHPGALVVRTSSFFGPWDAYNFVTVALAALRAGATSRADDVVVSPTYVPDLVHACLDLLIDGEAGLWHLASAGEGVSWARFAEQGARRANVGSRTLRAVPRDTIGWVAARPAYSVLGSERAVLLPPLESALARYVARLLAAA